MGGTNFPTESPPANALATRHIPSRRYCLFNSAVCCRNPCRGSGLSQPPRPAALGTHRVITVDPAQIRRVGTMQYPDTLPLRDHEPVLTFGDGPSPPYTARVLNTLQAEYVKVTSFVLGSMAKAHPDLLRRAYAEGDAFAVPSRSRPGGVPAAAVE